MDVVMWFQMGGVFMYGVVAALLVVGVGVGLALIAAIAAWFAPSIRWVARAGALLVLVGSGAPLLIGLVGHQVGLSQMEEALASVDPEMADAIRAQGSLEARVPLTFGGFASGLLVLPAALALVIAVAAPRRER